MPLDPFTPVPSTGPFALSREGLNALFGEVARLGRQRGGIIGAEGNTPFVEDLPEMYVRIIGVTHTSNQPPTYSWELVDPQDNAGANLNATQLSGSYTSWPAFETGGNPKVPTDGSILVHLRWGQGGPYFWFDYAENYVDAQIDGSDATTGQCAWHEVIRQQDFSWFTITAPQVRSGTTTVNSAKDRNGNPPPPTGTYVQLTRAYAAAADGVVSQNAPLVQAVYLTNAVGGTFQLIVVNTTGGFQLTAPIAWNATGAAVQAAINATGVVPNGGVTVGGGGTGTAANPWLVSYPASGYPLMVLDPLGLVGIQQWTFDYASAIGVDNGGSGSGESCNGTFTVGNLNVICNANINGTLNVYGDTFLTNVFISGILEVNQLVVYDGTTWLFPYRWQGVKCAELDKTWLRFSNTVQDTSASTDGVRLPPPSDAFWSPSITFALKQAANVLIRAGIIWQGQGGALATDLYNVLIYYQPTGQALNLALPILNQSGPHWSPSGPNDADTEYGEWEIFLTAGSWTINPIVYQSNGSSTGTIQTMPGSWVVIQSEPVLSLQPQTLVLPNGTYAEPPDPCLTDPVCPCTQIIIVSGSGSSGSGGEGPNPCDCFDCPSGLYPIFQIVVPPGSFVDSNGGLSYEQFNGTFNLRFAGSIVDLGCVWQQYLPDGGLIEFIPGKNTLVFYPDGGPDWLGGTNDFSNYVSYKTTVDPNCVFVGLNVPAANCICDNSATAPTVGGTGGPAQRPNKITLTPGGKVNTCDGNTGACTQVCLACNTYGGAPTLWNVYLSGFSGLSPGNNGGVTDWSKLNHTWPLKIQAGCIWSMTTPQGFVLTARVNANNRWILTIIDPTQTYELLYLGTPVGCDTCQIGWIAGVVGWQGGVGGPPNVTPGKLAYVLGPNWPNEACKPCPDHGSGSGTDLCKTTCGDNPCEMCVSFSNGKGSTAVLNGETVQVTFDPDKGIWTGSIVVKGQTVEVVLECDDTGSGGSGGSPCAQCSDCGGYCKLKATISAPHCLAINGATATLQCDAPNHWNGGVGLANLWDVSINIGCSAGQFVPGYGYLIGSVVDPNGKSARIYCPTTTGSGAMPNVTFQNCYFDNDTTLCGHVSGISISVSPA